MIEQIMYFLLGVCVSALATIALLPALWRRAVRLTRARLAATLPLTPEEIAAGKDQIRAAHVVEIRRSETRVQRAEADLQAAKSEVGRKILEVQAHQATIAARLEDIAALERTLSEKRQIISEHETTILTLQQERDNLFTNLTASRITNQALDQDNSNLRLTADQRHARIGTLEAQVDNLSARLSDSTAVSATLREEVTARNDALREGARALRDAENDLVIAQRRLAAAETLAEDRQRVIDALQAEKLRLIDEAGVLARARDHEHIERNMLATEIETHKQRHAEYEAALTAARSQHGEMMRELTRSVDSLRAERHKADEDLAALRLEIARLETAQKDTPAAPEAEAPATRTPRPVPPRKSARTNPPAADTRPASSGEPA